IKTSFLVSNTVKDDRPLVLAGDAVKAVRAGGQRLTTEQHITRDRERRCSVRTGSPDVAVGNDRSSGRSRVLVVERRFTGRIRRPVAPDLPAAYARSRVDDRYVCHADRLRDCRFRARSRQSKLCGSDGDAGKDEYQSERKQKCPLKLEHG